MPALIAAHAMLTSLGADAATSCASARAGLLRTQAVEGLRFIASTDGAPAPVIVHAVPIITQGFEGLPRLERLLSHALADLRERLPEPIASGDGLGVYLSLPSPLRHLTGLALFDQDDLHARQAARIDEFGGEPDPAGGDATFARRLLANAAAAAGFARTPELRAVSLAGHAGGAQCVAAALADLADGHVDCALVAGADSLLGESTLEWLASTSRLKLADMPVGLRPGEACAVLALTRPRHAAAAESCCAIGQVELGHEARSLLSGATSVGEGLSQTLMNVARAAAWDTTHAPWFIHDHNGEVYRANEWGHTLVRLRAEHAAIDGAQTWLPAASFGDTGAASALVGACVAVTAFERRYAPVDRGVIVSSSESTLRAAMVLGRVTPGAAAGATHGRP